MINIQITYKITSKLLAEETITGETIIDRVKND